MKCFDMASTQCNLSECNMAEVPSITTNTAMVRKNQTMKKAKMAKTPAAPVMLKAFASVMDHRTMDNC